MTPLEISMMIAAAAEFIQRGNEVLRDAVENRETPKDVQVDLGRRWDELNKRIQAARDAEPPTDPT